MDVDIAWRAWGRRTAWFIAGAFLIGSVMLLLLSFNITAPELTPTASGDMPDNVLAFFQNEEMRWPQDLTLSLLFALGFAAVAALGPTLRRLLGGDGPGATMVSLAFVAAGLLGVVAQLMYVGAKEIAIDPHYCDCQYAAHQLIARREMLDVVSNIQGWLTDGFTYLFAIGLLIAARLGSEGRLPAGLVAFSRVVAVAGIGTALFSRIVPPLFDSLGINGIDVGQIALLFLLVVAGVLIPIWAAWLGRSLGPQEPAAT